MSEIVVLDAEEFNARIMQGVREVFREEFYKLQDAQTDDSYKTRKEMAMQFGVLKVHH